MSITLIRILFFCLIPIGIFILIKGIQLIRKSFNGLLLLEISFLQQSGKFSIGKAGNFSIWQRAPLLKRTPVDQFKPHIINLQTNEEVAIFHSISGMQANNFSDGRMEMFTFSAPAGEFQLELRSGTSVTGLQSALTKLIPKGNLDLSKYFIQVRVSQPQIFAFLAIPIILIGAAGIIGGFVFGLLADRLFQ